MSILRFFLLIFAFTSFNINANPFNCSKLLSKFLSDKRNQIELKGFFNNNYNPNRNITNSQLVQSLNDQLKKQKLMMYPDQVLKEVDGQKIFHSNFHIIKELGLHLDDNDVGVPINLLEFNYRLLLSIYKNKYLKKNFL